jgi:hypothetical protein
MRYDADMLIRCLGYDLVMFNTLFQNTPLGLLLLLFWVTTLYLFLILAGLPYFDRLSRG